MPRRAREKSESGIYHVIVRGINRQAIFIDREDYVQYLKTLDKMKAKSGYILLGYCLMNNHIHLLIQEGPEGISCAMKRIGSAYAYWYNLKYKRSGYLFQDRFRSEKVDDEVYLLTVLRYIHLNPVKANIISSASDYAWSSYGAYLGNPSAFSGLIDKTLILQTFSMQIDNAVVMLKDFMEAAEDDCCLDERVCMKLTDEELKRQLSQKLNGFPVDTLQHLTKYERDIILKEAKGIKGSSIRQISRVTGISRNIVSNA